MIKKIRKWILVLWIVLILSLGYYVSSHRELLDPKILFAFFQSFGGAAISVYVIVSLLRGLVLLPSLPLVFVGVFFFPESPFLVFLISMLGIVFSGILIYQFSELMGFDAMFSEHVHSVKIKKAIERYGFFAVLVWSFAPVVPTDLICYIAGTVRMKFIKFVLALTIGEGAIVAIIIYGGKEVMRYFGV